MKHYLKSTVAFGIALSMLAAPVAMAQQDQHSDQHATDQHPTSAQHNVAPQHVTAPQHAQTQQHSSMPAQNQQHAQVQQHAMTPQHQTAQPQHQVVQSRPMQGQPGGHQMQASHQWHNGSHYTDSRRVVYQGDWDRYHLRHPPQGYEWVQDGDQFVLIAIASGIIADVILNSSYN